MKHLFLFCLFFLLAPAQADIYKGVNEEGQTIYSDKQLPNTEKIPTPTENTIKMPKPVIVFNGSTKAKDKDYLYLNIDKPTNEEIIRNNLGDLSVQFSINPALNTEKGHYIVFYLDSKEVGSDKQKATPDNKPAEKETLPDPEKMKKDKLPKIDKKTIANAVTSNTMLPNVDRGEHSIYATVFNKAKKALITSNIVTFHMKRTSIQHNKPFGTPPGPVNSNGQTYTPGPQGVIFKPGPITLPAQ